MEPRRDVLVVEDNDVNRALAVRQLEVLGCSPRAAATGPEAISAFLASPPDLILMDRHLPDNMDGLEITAAIREIESERGGHVPIVAMTASVTLQDRRDCLAAGMDDFLEKPVQVEDIREVLARWLGGDPGSIDADETAQATRGGRAARRRTSAPEAGGGAPPVDLATLRREAGDDATADRVIELFLGRLDARLEAIRRAASALDSVRLAAAAHELRSASAAVWAGGLMDVCGCLEAVGHGSTTSGTDGLLMELEAAAEDARAALEAAAGG